MSVYVDGVMEHVTNLPWKKWSHMWADTPDELHEMARKIGHKAEWFQPYPDHSLAHYDLVPSRRRLAISLGAIVRQITLDDFKRQREQGPTPMPEPW